MRYLLRRAAAVFSGIACALLLSACSADTEGATQITATEATLHAVVGWESGEDLAYWFELRRRPTGAWFRATVHDPGVRGGTGNTEITERVDGLTPATRYQFRLCGYMTAPLQAGSSSNPICFDNTGKAHGTDYNAFTTLDAPPVNLRPVDGGTDYYAQFSNPLPTSASFFPIGVWGSYNHTDANIATDKARGLNGYVWFADASTAGALQNAREAGMWSIVDKVDGAGLVGTETAARLTEDEWDMRCGPGATCYQQLENLIRTLPQDQRMLYANYGKGVLLWETEAEASRFINGTSSFGRYQDFVSTDLYWFTDPNQRNMQSVPWLPEGKNGEVTMTRNQVERASNYGYQIDYLRKLDAMDGKRQPIWQFVEVGCPWSECGSDFDAIKPAEIRAAVWHSLIAGARGIIYFQHTFNGPSGCVTHHALREPLACYSAVQSAVTDLNAQIKSLAPVLNAPFDDAYAAASASVRAMTKFYNGTHYIFAGSRQNVASTATFSVASGQTATVVGEGRSIAITNGRFTDSFANGNTIHIYRIG